MAHDERELLTKSSGTSDIAARVRHWRTRSGLRPVDLARSLDMSESVVSRWESGSAQPSLGTMRRIAEACGVTMSTFWSELPALTPEQDPAAK